ncbi:sterol carrier family protein [Nocardioides sp.]|uniref:sterol carrier family protein n=1 Tax=Nocardioides sp. TaxID=35761 RepID=UPI0026063D99|nr:sterol carrier family protein [Nocardioides sp.]
MRALDAQWSRLLEVLPGLDPAADSRVAGWQVREVEAHLTATTAGLARIIDADALAQADTDIAGWASALPGLADVADADARAGAADLAGAVAAARVALEGADEKRVVQQRTGAHTLFDAVRFRLIEGVVHGLDVGIDPDPIAQRLAVKAVVEILVARAPGHAVELRIPPYTAVQVVEGPRHTRGTPPNVVELGPRAFLDLASGRAQWHDAVRDGQVRASGERADLSAYLPLIS